jgi:hypothetical protein
MVDARESWLRSGGGDARNRRQPRPTPRPVEPTPPPPSPLDWLGQNYARANQARVDNMVKYGGETGGLGSRTADLLVNQGVSDSPGLRAGALAGDIIFDPSWIVPGVGAANVAGRAAQNVGRTALGTTARTLRTNPNMSPGMRNVFELISARHASGNPNLANELIDPANVPVKYGRDWGPGFYYEANRPLTSTVPYTDLLAKYGENFYMPNMSFSDMVRIARSRGMASPAQDLGINRGINRMTELTMDSPQIQDAMRRGFTGVEGWTNWLVGNPARVGGLPNLGVRPVTPADDAAYPALEALLRRIFER